MIADRFDLIRHNALEWIHKGVLICNTIFQFPKRAKRYDMLIVNSMYIGYLKRQKKLEIKF